MYATIIFLRIIKTHDILSNIFDFSYENILSEYVMNFQIYIVRKIDCCELSYFELNIKSKRVREKIVMNTLSGLQ